MVHYGLIKLKFNIVDCLQAGCPTISVCVHCAVRVMTGEWCAQCKCQLYVGSEQLNPQSTDEKRENGAADDDKMKLDHPAA